jgi:hypothetical protein
MHREIPNVLEGFVEGVEKVDLRRPASALGSLCRYKLVALTENSSGAGASVFFDEYQ